MSTERLLKTLIMPSRYLWLWVSLAWLADGVFRAAQNARALIPGMTFERCLIQETSSSIMWIVITLSLIIFLRQPWQEQLTRLRWIAMLIVLVAGIVVLRAAFIYVTDPVLGWYPQLPAFSEVVAMSAARNFVGTWMLIGATYAFVQYERAQQRAQRIAELEAGLATARLDALRAQMHPHFLFNALNSVAEMVHHDADVADRMLVSLAALLREGLSGSDAQERALGEELTLVRHYLMIEKIRLGDRLQVEWQIDERCVGVPVPVLALQPLVENAIIHEIARSRQGGWLRIGVSLQGDHGHIRVENSVNARGSSQPRSGIGLQSIRDRLALLYGDRASFTKTVLDPSRFVVELSIPVQSTATEGSLSATA